MTATDHPRSDDLSPFDSPFDSQFGSPFGSQFDVVAVGAGLAGVAAAATAAASHCWVVVLSGGRAGGRAATTDRAGFHFKQGPRALYVGGPGMRVLRGLGIEPRGGRPAPVPVREAVLNGDPAVVVEALDDVAVADHLLKRASRKDPLMQLEPACPGDQRPTGWGRPPSRPAIFQSCGPATAEPM